MATIGDLPEEIVQKIVAELDPRSLTIASEVNAHWRTLVEQNILKNEHLRRTRAEKCE